MSFLIPRALADAIHVQTAAELRWQALGSVTSPVLSAEWEVSQALAPGLPFLSKVSLQDVSKGQGPGFGGTGGGLGGPRDWQASLVKTATFGPVSMGHCAPRESLNLPTWQDRCVPTGSSGPLCTAQMWGAMVRG